MFINYNQFLFKSYLKKSNLLLIKNMKTLILFDVDGTLTESRKRII